MAHFLKHSVLGDRRSENKTIFATNLQNCSQISTLQVNMQVAASTIQFYQQLKSLK